MTTIIYEQCQQAHFHTNKTHSMQILVTFEPATCLCILLLLLLWNNKTYLSLSKNVYFHYVLYVWFYLGEGGFIILISE
jgi:hypothetical protein